MSYLPRARVARPHAGVRRARWTGVRSALLLLVALALPAPGLAQVADDEASLAPEPPTFAEPAEGAAPLPTDDSVTAEVEPAALLVDRALGSARPSVFVGDFETGDLSQWTMAQQERPGRIRVVRSPVRQGRYAARHELRYGDLVNGGSRSELLWGRSRYATLRPGTDLYFGWSTYFPGEYPSPPPRGGHSVFLQWKDDGVGEPPLYLNTIGEQINLRVPSGNLWSTRLTRRSWHDFVARVRFSSSPRSGLVELWHNGDKVVSGRHVRTLRPGRLSYLKLGYYRHQRIRTPGYVVHDAMRVGRSYAAVAP